MHYCRAHKTEVWALCSACNRLVSVHLCHLPQLGLNSLVKPKMRLLVIQDTENEIWNLIWILKSMKVWNLMTEEMFGCYSRTRKPSYTGISALWHENISYLYYILGFTLSPETVCLQLQHLSFIGDTILYFKVMSGEAKSINHVLWWTEVWRKGRVCGPGWSQTVWCSFRALLLQEWRPSPAGHLGSYRLQVVGFGVWDK